MDAQRSTLGARPSVASCGGVTRAISTKDRPPKTPSAGADVVLDDRGARLVGIPFFALLITHFSGVLGPYGPATSLYWLGCGWFILLSAILWHANRSFLEWLRHRYDWPFHPGRKVLLLLGANVLSTVPLTGVWHVLWYRFRACNWTRGASSPPLSPSWRA